MKKTATKKTKAEAILGAIAAFVKGFRARPPATPPWHDNQRGTSWRDESAEEELQRKREINERGAAIRAQRASVLAQALGFERDRDPDVSIPGDWLKPPHEKPYRPRR